ncbi:MAG: TolC family protein [bacterium]
MTIQATLSVSSLMLFFLMPAVDAQTDTTILSPDAVVQLALAHSPDLKGRNEELRSATARRHQADAGLMPQLDTRAQALHFEGLENGSLGPGVTFPVISEQYSASIGITQPLYTGGRVTQQRRSAQYGEDAARHSLSAAAADLELQVITAYWQWSKALTQIEAFQVAVARMEAQNTDTRNLKNAGMATDNDLLATEVLLDQTQLQFQEARQQADISRIQLTQLTGHDFTSRHVPQKPAIPVLAPLPSLAEAVTHALTNREDLAGLCLNSKASAALVEASCAEHRPQLALIARYEQGSPNPRDFPPDDKWRDDAFIGGAITWNLFDGGLTRARTAEAKARAARDTFQVQSLGEAVVAQIKVAYLNRQYLSSRLKTATHAEASATRNLKVATDLWKNGAARHSDVLDAETKLTTTIAQRIAAEADLLIAEATLHHAMGDSLAGQ